MNTTNESIINILGSVSKPTRYVGNEWNSVERRTSNVVRQDLPEIHSFLSLEPQNLILTAFKKAEDSDDIIIRFYESEGRETSAEIKFGFQVKEAGETDLMEKEIRGIPLQDGKITLKTGKYEIKTLRLKM